MGVGFGVSISPGFEELIPLVAGTKDYIAFAVESADIGLYTLAKNSPVGRFSLSGSRTRYFLEKCLWNMSQLRQSCRVVLLER